MKKIHLLRISFSLVGLLGLAVMMMFAQPALAQRPDKAIPDRTGPGETGPDPGGALLQSGRFLSLVRGLNSLGQIDDDLPDPAECVGPGDPVPECDFRPKRHISFRVPNTASEFTIFLFDGDTRSDGPGIVSAWDGCAEGFCDVFPDLVKYTLYYDPSGPVPDEQLPDENDLGFPQPPSGNSLPLWEAQVIMGTDMLDNRWKGITIQQDSTPIEAGTQGACGFRDVDGAGGE